MSKQHQEGFTASGRRKRQYKWTNLLKAKNEEYCMLLHQVAELENEKTSLQAKETLLLQVLDTFQALVADADSTGEADHGCGAPLLEAVEAAGAAAAAATHDAPHGSQLHPEVMLWNVQQRENEIGRMYGDLLHNLYPFHEQEMRGLKLLKALYGPSNVQAGAITCEELTTHLSNLASRCALYLLQKVHIQQPDTPASRRSVSGPLLDAYMEFSTLVMTAMLWHEPTFHTIMSTNLETQQPFEQLPPAQHWLDALEKLELTEEQLDVLVCLYEVHLKANWAKIQEAMNVNVRQQEANTEALQQLRQLQACKQQLGSADSSVALSKDCTTGGGPVSKPAAASKDLILQISALMESQEALAEEQTRIMRHWLLLGVHVGIVCACTLSTYQQAMFVAMAYPSIPRMDKAMAAYQAQRQGPAERQQPQEQQPQPQQSSSGPGVRQVPHTPSGPNVPALMQPAGTSNKQDGQL